MVRQLFGLVVLVAMVALCKAFTADQCANLPDNVKFDCVDPSGGDPCIMQRYYCDGIADCGDGSDEDCGEDAQQAICDSDYISKGLDYFQCDDKMCMDPCRRCDGKCDCLDHSDEANCSAQGSGCTNAAPVDLC